MLSTGIIKFEDFDFAEYVQKLADFETKFSPSFFAAINRRVGF
jgi:hypothetical protein